MAVSARGDRVVLIHGLWMHGAVMSLLGKRLRERGFQPQFFSYPSVRHGLDEHAAALRDFVGALGAGTVHLLGHSLGGVLALRALDDWPNARPGRALCLGSPLAGCQAAQRLAAWPGGSRLLGPALRDARAGVPLVRCPPERDVGVIAGTLGIGLGRLLGPLAPPHDGVVSVTETRLPGLRDHLQLPLSHTALIASRRVADQAAWFLREGRFRREA